MLGSLSSQKVNSLRGGELMVTGFGGGNWQGLSWDGTLPLCPCQREESRSRPPRDLVAARVWTCGARRVTLSPRGACSASPKAGERPLPGPCQAPGQRPGGQTEPLISLGPAPWPPAGLLGGPAASPGKAASWPLRSFCSVRGQSLLLPDPLSNPEVTPQIKLPKGILEAGVCKQRPGHPARPPRRPSAAENRGGATAAGEDERGCGRGTGPQSARLRGKRCFSSVFWTACSSFCLALQDGIPLPRGACVCVCHGRGRRRRGEGRVREES